MKHIQIRSSTSVSHRCTHAEVINGDINPQKIQLLSHFLSYNRMHRYLILTQKLTDSQLNLLQAMKKK